MLAIKMMKRSEVMKKAAMTATAKNGVKQPVWNRDLVSTQVTVTPATTFASRVASKVTKARLHEAVAEAHGEHDSVRTVIEDLAGELMAASRRVCHVENAHFALVLERCELRKSLQETKDELMKRDRQVAELLLALERASATAEDIDAPVGDSLVSPKTCANGTDMGALIPSASLSECQQPCESFGARSAFDTEPESQALYGGEQGQADLALTSAIVEDVMTVRDRLQAQSNADDDLRDGLIRRLRSIASDLNSTVVSTGQPSTLDDVLGACGLSQLLTPKTGNCQFFALVEGATQRSFTDLEYEAATGSMDALEQLQRMEQATAMLKRGISGSARLNFENEYEDDSMINYLIDAQRENAFVDGDAEANRASLREYFDAVASSASDSKTIISFAEWGCQLTLKEACKVLGRPIHVLCQSNELCFQRWAPVDPSGPASLFMSVDATFTQAMREWVSSLLHDLESSVSHPNAAPIIVVLSLSGLHYSGVAIDRSTTPSEPVAAPMTAPMAAPRVQPASMPTARLTTTKDEAAAASVAIPATPGRGVCKQAPPSPAGGVQVQPSEACAQQPVPQATRGRQSLPIGPTQRARANVRGRGAGVVPSPSPSPARSPTAVKAQPQPTRKTTPVTPPQVQKPPQKQPKGQPQNPLLRVPRQLGVVPSPPRPDRSPSMSPTAAKTQSRQTRKTMTVTPPAPQKQQQKERPQKQPQERPQKPLLQRQCVPRQPVGVMQMCGPAGYLRLKPVAATTSPKPLWR